MTENPKHKMAEVSHLLVNGASTCHTVCVDEKDENVVMNVWLKEPTFLQMQDAIKSFVNIYGSGSIELDLAGYWRFMFENCIDRTEPQLSRTQMVGLRPHVANQIVRLLPQPQELLAPFSDGLNE